MTVLRVAAIQLRSAQDREENLTRASALMEEAVGSGAQLIALPENFSFLARDSDKIPVAETLETGPSVELLRSFAVRHNVAIVGGSIPLETRDPQKVSNTCLVFDETGDIKARYDKIHMFNVAVDDTNTFQESRSIQAGTEIVTLEVCGRTMGVAICYDLRFPELFRSLALRGADVIFLPSAFTRETGRHHWEVLLRARAIENLCYVVAPAQWGEHGAGRESFGHTMIVGPWGDVLAVRPEGEGVIVHDLDFDTVASARRRLPSLSHIRLPSIG